MKPFVVGLALVFLGLSLNHAVAQGLLPTRIFEGTATTPAPNGAVQAVRVEVQSWRISGQLRAPQQIPFPLQGFYLAHLLSGNIATTISGRTVNRVAGDYWAVRAGATMQVTVLGESALLETIVLAKR